jgi:hypothetical protein
VAGILSPPILADVFRCFVQPIRVSQQGDQFDGAKEFHRVGFLLAERPQFPRAGENGDIVRSSSITNIRMGCTASFTNWFLDVFNGRIGVV